MTRAEHYREAERLAAESEATMRETPREAEGSTYKDRRSARLLQLAKLHAMMAGVPAEVEAMAARLPDPCRPRRPFAPGGPVMVMKPERPPTSESGVSRGPGGAR